MYKAIHSLSGYIVWSMADQHQHKEQNKCISAPDYDTQLANAALIAAAPELAEAASEYRKCERALLAPECDSSFPSIIAIKSHWQTKMDAALKKAGY